MRQPVLVLTTLVVALGFLAPAARAFTWDDAPKAEPEPETQPGKPPEVIDPKVRELEAALEAGEFDKVINEGMAFVRATRNEDAKTAALKLVADATREKGDWRQVHPAYARLRDRYPKGSDWYLRYDAVCEVVRSAPGGVYGAKPAEGTAPTLADEAVLAKALEDLAETRAAKLKSRHTALKRARRPQDVISRLSELAEGYKAVRAISPTIAEPGEREAATAAGQQLASMMKTVGKKLQMSLAQIRESVRLGRISNRLRAETAQLKALAEGMADAEAAYQKGLGQLGGKDWDERAQLRKESEERRTKYQDLSKEFFIPEPEDDDDEDDRRW